MRRLAGAAMILMALAGCGGGGGADKPKPEHRGGGGEEAERAQSLRGARPADLAAFYQVALAAGELRQWGAAGDSPIGSEVRRSKLRGDLDRLRDVHPVDGALSRARRDAMDALRDAVAAGRPSRAEARRGLARADHLRAAVDKLVRSDPRYSALMPD